MEGLEAVRSVFTLYRETRRYRGVKCLYGVEILLKRDQKRKVVRVDMVGQSE